MNDSALVRFFGVVRRPRTWLGILFHWLAFPLGLFYFVFLVTGLSLGVGLVVVWVGIPILLVVAGAWWLFGAFERLQAKHLLGADVPPAPREWEKVDGVWAKLKAHFGSAATWKDLVYLLAKLPFGIVSTTLLVDRRLDGVLVRVDAVLRRLRRAGDQQHLGAAAVVRHPLPAAGHPRVLRGAARAQRVELGVRPLGRGDVPRPGAGAGGRAGSRRRCRRPARRVAPAPPAPPAPPRPGAGDPGRAGAPAAPAAAAAAAAPSDDETAS